MNFDMSKFAFSGDSRLILTTTGSSPRSVKEIAKLCSLPLSKCYRLIKEMEERQMLKRTELEGTKATTYLSNIRSMGMALEEEALCFSIEFLDGTRAVMQLGENGLASSSTRCHT
jgi:hypothetical protein